MSEQKIAPVLSDDEIKAILNSNYLAATRGDRHYYEADLRFTDAIAIEQAVLARVGAVRDQALGQAADLLDAAYNAVTGREPYDQGKRDALDIAEQAIRALKGTPAAAVGGCNGSHDYSAIASGIESECTVCTAEAPQPSSNPGPLAAVELPPLPRHNLRCVDHDTGESLHGFSADRMREYARAAIAASKGANP